MAQPKSTAPAGQWVWVPDPTGQTPGQWSWFVPGHQDKGFNAARIGMFVGGYFCMGLVFSAYAAITQALTGDEPSVAAALVGFAFAAALFFVARATDKTEVEPLGIVAAFQSNIFVATSTGLLVTSLGLGGTAGFWVGVAVAGPLLLLTLVRFPHPSLGFSVAVVVVIAFLNAPFGDGAVAAKAISIGVALVLVALFVEARTRTRAGSLLHYGAVIAMLVAKFATVNDLTEAEIGLPASTALLPLALLELAIAIVTQRRSWTLSSWLTLAAALGGAVAWLLSPFGVESVLDDIVGYTIGPGIVAFAFFVQSKRAQLSQQLIAMLPDVVRPKVLFFAPTAPPPQPPMPPMPVSMPTAPPTTALADLPPPSVS